MTDQTVTEDNGMEREEPTPREVAASIATATQSRDPIVDYADSDVHNLWVDVCGKVDSLGAPYEDFGLVPATIHPTVSDHDDDVTRVWYRSLQTGTDRSVSEMTDEVDNK